ncbi:pilus assembly protein TadG-related protein [Streptomyces sp. NBC_00237]|uniref:pilus assembly protein TadG-related protein n=1 Tax=Streptomyces sp. NBC_00237 TaxID=2975687 RepID=UPI00224DF625|nr:pilus assembly protein TadG-related protein [Streptomyces sp. NBC_00237]MCX5204530.1 pilus assembly protein TadG-related protein [Streptomyces sp. NBC_00237]
MANCCSGRHRRRGWRARRALTTDRSQRDRGQAFPIYIGMVGLLLFVAFAFFAFAQAATARSGGQSAADAAALAAAQEARDELTEGFFDNIAAPELWLPWLLAEKATGNGGGAAAALAASNDSALTAGPALGQVNGNPSFSVEIRTNYTAGDSVIPATSTSHAEAKATAVVKPLCVVVPGGDPEVLVVIDCEGSGIWTIDPKKIADMPLDQLPEAKDLFSVHLVK